MPVVRRSDTQLQRQGEAYRCVRQKEQEHLGKLFEHTKKRETLHKAWRRIRSNGTRSKSDETRRAIEDFERTSRRDIWRIQKRLGSGNFVFEDQKGVLLRKKSGGKRGIVMASVHNRIVERSLLETLQEKSDLVSRISSEPSSFGGVPHRSVPHALKFLNDAFETGARFFVRSDISSFFDGIPRKDVLDIICKDVDDRKFLALLTEATTVTLANQHTLGEDRDVFPTDSEGVAQGSPLSPLFGNILLNRFDRQFNDRGIVCARFIDDFVLLGSSEAKVYKAFESAKIHLLEMGLQCHDPFSPSATREKTEHGKVEGGFDFLGYFCSPGLFQPSKKARNGIRETIDSHLSAGRKSIKEVRKAENSFASSQRYSQTLVSVDRVLRGWADSFAYTTSNITLEQLDRDIDEKLDVFRKWFARELDGADWKTRRRLGGVGLITDIGRKTFDDVSFQIEQGGRFRKSDSTILISTDGALASTKKQRKKERCPGGWGFVVHGSDVEKSGFDLATTNNRMELTAVIEALRSVPNGSSVIVRTDSRYIDQVRNNGAAVKQNSDLWKQFEEEALQRKVKIVWIKGHAGDPHNERADVLAGEAAEEARLMAEIQLVPSDTP